MALIEVDIDLEDYLDEVKSRYLVKELNKRGYKIPEKKEDVDVKEESEFTFRDFETAPDVIKFLKKFMGLQHYQDNERLLTEIKDLF